MSAADSFEALPPLPEAVIARPARKLPPLPKRLGGAIIRKELITLLRSFKAFAFLGIVLGLLSAIVVIAWPPETLIGLRAALSRKLFSTIATGEFVVLAFLAPVFSAGAITLEREKQCLDLLLTTPLGPTRILWEKFVSAFLYLLMVLIATAPVVAVTLFLGGVSLGELILSYLLFATAGAIFAVIGLCCSTFFQRTFGALVASYLVVLPVAAVILWLYSKNTAAAFTRGGEISAGFVLGFILWGSLFSVLPFVIAVARLRKPPPPPKPIEEEDPADQRILSLDRTRFPDKLLVPGRLGTYLEDWRNPVLEKEVRFEIFGKGSLLMRVIILVGFVAAIPFLCTLITPYEYLYGVYLIIFALLVTPAFAASSITQERERETLDLLMATPLAPHTIVLGKLLGTVRSPLVLIALLVPYYMFGVLTTEVSIYELLVDLFVVATAVIQCAAIGLAMSALCPTTLAAMVSSYSVLLTLYVGPIIASVFLEQFTRLSYSTIASSTITSPLAAIMSARGTAEEGSLPARFAEGLGGIPIWSIHLLFSWALTAIAIGVTYSVMARLARPRAA